MLSSPCYLCLIENASVYIYIYMYIFRFYFTVDLFVTSMNFMRTSCSGQIKSAGSTFEIAGFGVLHVRK